MQAIAQHVVTRVTRSPSAHLTLEPKCLTVLVHVPRTDIRDDDATGRETVLEIAQKTAQGPVLPTIGLTSQTMPLRLVNQTISKSLTNYVYG